MGEATIALGLGLGGGKASTASGRPGGGGGFANQYSLSMDGTDDYLNIPHDSSLTISGDLTICAWVKRTALANGEYLPILTKRPATHTSTNYSFYLDALDGAAAGGLRFYDGNSVISPASATAIAAGTWTHVAITVDSGVTNGTKWYINGSAEANTSTATINKTNTDPVMVGKLGAANIYGEGLIDEVALFDSALSASDITTIYNSGTPADISSLSPLGWWRMGDNDGGTGTTVTDQGSGGNDATLTNGPTFATAVPPKLSTMSASFDGTNDYLAMGTSALSIDANFTISAWIYPDSASVSGYRMIGGWGNFTNGQMRAMELLNGKLSLEIWAARISGSTTLSHSNWHHVAITLAHDASGGVGGSAVTIYVNGSSDGTGSYSRSAFSTSTTFVAGHATPTASGFNPFDGLIDEFSVFNSVLSASQIASIYNSGQPADLTSLSPVGWWRMGDGTGDTDSGGGAPANTDVIGTVADQGSGGNNATGTNGPTYSSTTP